MEMTSGFSKEFSLAFPRINFSPDTSPLPFLVSTPLLFTADYAQSLWWWNRWHRRLGSVHGSFLFATRHFFLFSATVPSFLFHLHWCGLLCGPQFPGRWHGVPVSKRVSPALCTIMFASRCFLARLLWCIPPHPPVFPAHSGCCPFLTRFERLWCWCMVAWFHPLPNCLGPQGWPLQPALCHLSPTRYA